MSIALDHGQFRAAAPKLDREERRAVVLPGWLIREDDSTLDITVADLSYGGCKVICDAPLRRGEYVRLSVPRRGLVKAEVRWNRGNQAGLIFKDFERPQPHWPRRAERVQVSATIQLRRYGKLKYEVRVFDISTHGCKTEFVDLPAADERVCVKIAGIEPIEAEVSWLNGHTGGLKFLKPLHSAVLALLLAKLQTA